MPSLKMDKHVLSRLRARPQTKVRSWSASSAFTTKDRSIFVIAKLENLCQSQRRASFGVDRAGGEEMVGEMSDWSVVNVPAVLRRKVRTYDEQGREIDDRSWYDRTVERHYVLAEFLSSTGLLRPGLSPERDPSLVIMYSDLTALGQRFAMSGAIDRWVASVDRAPFASPLGMDGLHRRWRQFLRKSGAGDE